MPKLENGQKVFIFVDFVDGENYTKIRQDRVLELYTDNNGVDMIEFMYLPCDLPLSELDKTIFTDEVKAKKVFEEQKIVVPKVTPKKYKAYLSITPNFGLGIIDIEYGIDDYCINELIVGQKVTKGKNKIYYDTDGRAYIKKYNVKYFIDEFLRTDL
jgi:hypothetical protein